MSTVDWLLVGLAGPLYLAGIHVLIRLDAHRCGDDTCTEDHGERAGVAS